jgi:hypothetical protein
MSKTISAPSMPRYAALFACLFLSLVLFAAGARAQSANVDQPTPVTANQIAGQITPRDIGDSRLTRHFYLLVGTPGDLVITVESRNLNGDIDLFQSGTLRPLAKVSMYAGELSTSTSKSIYLRQRENIILRVEARTPNDDKGEYRVSFSGGFEALAAPVVEPGAATESLPATTSSAPRRGNTRRVSSVGARIEEPEPPVETAKTEPTETSAGASSEEANRPAGDGDLPANTSPGAVTTARIQRPPSPRANRRRRGRATPSAPPQTATQNTAPGTTATEDAPPMLTQPSGIEAGAKLIIETRDGMRVERFMSTVRRVTVENGQIVVITRDGKVTRHPMTNVTRMAIEP